MVLLAPPAAARRFIEQNLVQALGELRIELIQQLEIVVIVGGTCLFEFGEKTLIGLKDNLPIAPVGNPGNKVFLFPIKHLLHEGRKHLLPFTDDDIVNPWKSPEMLETHLAAEIRAPEHDSA